MAAARIGTVRALGLHRFGGTVTDATGAADRRLAAPVSPRAPAPVEPADPAKPARRVARDAGVLGTVAAVTAWSSQAVAWGKSWGVDRSRLAVSTAAEGRRLVAEHPEWGRATRARAYVTGSADAARPLRLARDLVVGPSNQTVPLSGGTVRLPGGARINDTWGKGFRASNRLGASLGALNGISGAVNLASGLQQRGISGLHDTREGRMGVLQLGSLAWGLTVNGRAAAFHRDVGQSARRAWFGATWLGTPRTKLVEWAGYMTLGLLATANLVGGLDALNADPDPASTK